VNCAHQYPPSSQMDACATAKLFDVEPLGPYTNDCHVALEVCHSVRLSVCLCVFLSLSVVYLVVCVCPVYLHVSHSVCLYVCLSVCLSLCLKWSHHAPAFSNSAPGSKGSACVTVCWLAVLKAVSDPYSQTGCLSVCVSLRICLSVRFVYKMVISCMNTL